MTAPNPDARMRLETIAEAASRRMGHDDEDDAALRAAQTILNGGKP